MRSCHQGSRRMSATHACEMFQSSWTSWSSKIMVLGTVESSHRMSGSLHDSRCRRVYSSKFATSPGGGVSTLSSAWALMNSAVSGDISSA